MPMLYQAMPKLYRPGAQSPPQSKWMLGSGRPRAIAHQAGMTKLNGVIGATDWLAKTDALAWKPLHKFTTRHLDRVVNLCRGFQAKASVFASQSVAPMTPFNFVIPAWCAIARGRPDPSIHFDCGGDCAPGRYNFGIA